MGERDLEKIRLIVKGSGMTDKPTSDHLTRLRAFQRELERRPGAITPAFMAGYGGDPSWIGVCDKFASDLGALLDEREALREALTDMRAGWRYIRRYHGDLGGVGWDRCEQAADAALSSQSTGELND